MLSLPSYISKQRKKELEYKTERLDKEVIEKEPDLLERIQQKANFLEKVFQGPEDGRHIRICTVLDEFFEGIEEEGSKHSQLMFSLTLGVALKMDFNLEESMKISLASILHDIGKTVLPESLKEKMRQNEYFDEKDYKRIQSHVLRGKMIAERIPTLLNIYPKAPSLIFFHHERSDGRGYLLGLKGHNLYPYNPDLYRGEIPLESMIISVCDAYLAIARKRGYNEPESLSNEGLEEIIQELLRCSEDNFNSVVTERSNASKISVWKEKWKGKMKYNRMIRERLARNMLFGKLPVNLSITYDEIFRAPLKQIEEAYKELRCKSEGQFYKAVVKALAKYLNTKENIFD